MSAEAAQNRSEELICDSCGHVNPGENNFCGNCGTPIRLAAERLAETAAEQHVAEQLPSFAEIFGLESPSQRRSCEQSPISGPSFLGLDGEPTTPAPDFGYAESGSHAGRWVALFVVLGLIAVGVAEWKSIRGVVLQRAAQLQSYTKGAPSPQPQAPTPSSAATEQNPVSSTPAETASPEPARANDSSSSADAAKADVGNTATNSAASTSSPGTPEASKPQAAEEEDSAEAAQSPEANTKQEGRTAKNRRQDRIDEASPRKSRRSTGQVRRNRQIEETKPSLAPDNSLVLAGEKYLYGRGAPRSCQQALVYFRTAAQAQNPRAMSHLGTMYATGTCVRQDRVQAYHWLSQALAEESNNHFLEQNLTMLWRDMTPAEKQVVTRSR